MPVAKRAVRGAGTLALIGGGEWSDGCRGFDTELLASSGADEVIVLPTAAAFEHPERVADRASAYLTSLGATARPLMVLHRGEAEDAKTAETVRKARFVYLSDGSPLHLRSVLKDSALFEAMLAAYHAGGVLAASGAGATLVCDPMVDPRGGAYTVGLGVVAGLAVFPYHGERGRPPPGAVHRPAARTGPTGWHRRADRAASRPARRLAGRRRRLGHRVPGPRGGPVPRRRVGRGARRPLSAALRCSASWSTPA